MKKYTVHYKTRQGKAGHITLAAADPFDAVCILLTKLDLTFRDLAGVLSKSATDTGV